jgi:hypothetical protein
MMPIMGGWEIHKRIGENTLWKKIPVMLIIERDNETA